VIGFNTFNGNIELQTFTDLLIVYIERDRMIAINPVLPVPSKKQTINAAVESSLKDEFERLCEIEQRSMSNMVILLITQAVATAKREGKL